MIQSILFICVGRLKEKYFIDACKEYKKRLGAYTSTKIIELDETNSKNTTDLKTTLKREAAEILGRIPKGAYIITLCIEGEKLSSKALSEKLEKLAVNGNGKLCIIIGGSNGLDDTIKENSDFKLSMSDMTFPHHLARVMALEQFYRAMSISANAKYHK